MLRDDALEVFKTDGADEPLSLGSQSLTALALDERGGMLATADATNRGTQGVACVERASRVLRRRV